MGVYADAAQHKLRIVVYGFVYERAGAQTQPYIELQSRVGGQSQGPKAVRVRGVRIWVGEKLAMSSRIQPRNGKPILEQS